MTDHFRVTPADVSSHAAAVSSHAASVSSAVDAGKSVILDGGAFGVLCAPMALILNGVGAVGVAVGANRASSLRETATSLRESVAAYHERDQHHSSAFDGLKEKVDGHDAYRGSAPSGASGKE